jgi:outer membrane lipoprotein-sorting protein
MKKLFFTMMAFVAMTTAALAQTAQQVLDKCAQTVSVATGVSASFTMNSAQYGNASGTIAIKGQKFHMVSDAATMWFDGQTLWTYMAENEEVNISTPTSQQLQTLNPYNFVNLYKQGYKSTMTTSGSAFNVHLTSTDASHKISEAFLTIDKTSYAPKEIKLLQGTKWTTFTISSLKKNPIADAEFRFDSSAYPNAELIDLR